jgi:hypothetical protein
MRWRVLLAGLIPAATLGVAVVTTFLPGVPRWWGPLPVTVVFPIFLLQSFVLGFVPIVLVALLLATPVLLGRTRVPLWTALPVAGLVLLAWYWFARGVEYGFKYQGTTYVAVCGSLQIAATVFLAWISTRKPRFAVVFAWHLLAAVWLASYAFPYYGELP